MFLDDDQEALSRYLRGDRVSEHHHSVLPSLRSPRPLSKSGGEGSGKRSYARNGVHLVFG